LVCLDNPRGKSEQNEAGEHDRSDHCARHGQANSNAIDMFHLERHEHLREKGRRDEVTGWLMIPQGPPRCPSDGPRPLDRSGTVIVR
jgi:hypothetical protein